MCGCQIGNDLSDLVLKRRCGFADEVLTRIGDVHQHAPTVDSRRTSPYETTLLGAIDQAGDARLVQSQEPGELFDGGLAVSEDTEQASLDNRQVMQCGDPAKRTLHREGQLRQSVHETEVSLSGQRGENNWLVRQVHTIRLVGLDGDTNYYRWEHQLLVP